MIDERAAEVIKSAERVANRSLPWQQKRETVRVVDARETNHENPSGMRHWQLTLRQAYSSPPNYGWSEWVEHWSEKI